MTYEDAFNHIFCFILSETSIQKMSSLLLKFQCSMSFHDTQNRTSTFPLDFTDTGRRVAMRKLLESIIQIEKIEDFYYDRRKSLLFVEIKSIAIITAQEISNLTVRISKHNGDQISPDLKTLYDFSGINMSFVTSYSLNLNLAGIYTEIDMKKLPAPI